jgi:Zn-dependent M28 family amino/carboxypeptidase
LASQKVIVASHYDTKIFRTIPFVGANDGASSTGALLELARVLALDPALATKVELAFFDGEEAVQQFTETDGLYGSRYYATQLRDSGRAPQFKAGIVWDMIGDKDLTITLPIDSPKDLTLGMLASADKLKCKNAFRIFERPMLDDHIPLIQIARIPSLDVIDFDYAPWHTADDTLDKLSAASLQTIGTVTLHYLKQTF